MSIQTEIEIKELLQVFIYSSISYFNSHIHELCVEKDFQNYKPQVVIGGGEAINYWFDNVPPVFRTHDFDLRMMYLNPPPYFKVNEETRNKMAAELIKLSKCFMFYISNTLNAITEPTGAIFNKTKECLRKKNIMILKSQIDSSGELVNDPNGLYFNFVDKSAYIPDYPPYYVRTLQYLYKDIKNNVEGVNSLIDIIPFAWIYLDHYRTTPAIQMSEKDFEDRLLGGYVNLDNVRRGYFPLDPEVTEMGDSKVWVLKLGYIIWDTMRVLNEKFDISRAEGRATFKLGRYMKKYRDMIELVNNFETYINCNRVPALYQRCLNEPQVCTGKDKNYTREEILQNLHDAKIFAPDQLERVAKLDLKYLCNLVDIFEKC